MFLQIPSFFYFEDFNDQLQTCLALCSLWAERIGHVTSFSVLPDITSARALHVTRQRPFPANPLQPLRQLGLGNFLFCLYILYFLFLLKNTRKLQNIPFSLIFATPLIFQCTFFLYLFFFNYFIPKFFITNLTKLINWYSI